VINLIGVGKAEDADEDEEQGDEDDKLTEDAEHHGLLSMNRFGVL
jgi:hypothetical protein